MSINFCFARKTCSRLIIIILFCSFSPLLFAQQKDTVRFTLSLSKPETHIVHVTMTYNADKTTVRFKMPQWTTGYYQIMNYAQHVKRFTVTDHEHQPLQWNKMNGNTWTVQTPDKGSITLDYDVVADSAFVATSFIDTTHAYITPAATFMYADKQLSTPVALTIQSYKKWSRIATGLDSVADKTYTYIAPDFDVLYDCPILAGNLEELPSFDVEGVTHRFIGYQLGDFNKAQLMADVKRIVETGVNIIKDIPYKHYTFLAIGPGNGGIEHLTSSALSFNGASLNTDNGRKRMLSFIAHEYFHNYNVKRIRPVELGPFDYDKGSKTRQLWISEGWTVYYEYLILRRAGLISNDDLFNYLRENIRAYETGVGRHFQSLVQASEETWSDGPFGRQGDEVNKTISYYDKGPVVALMLDFAIRHYTQNKQSLDDVMRRLYTTFYKQKNCGFTEKEFWNTCRQIAGNQVSEIQAYVNSTEELNYARYFNYGGLAIDTFTKELPGAYTGLHTRTLKDTLIVISSDWQSPAWKAGIRSQTKILAIKGQPATTGAIEAIEKTTGAGSNVVLTVIQHRTRHDVTIKVAQNTDRSFTIQPSKNQDALQAAILKSWAK